MTLSLIAGLGVLLELVGLALLVGVFRRGGWLVRLRRLVLGTLAVACGSLCVLSWGALHAFQAFAMETPVADVTCQWISPKEFELTYADIAGTAPHTFRFHGDQWTIAGGIVKWHPWLTALGLPSYHKPTRVSGRFARLSDERAFPPTAEALNGGEDLVWEWFYRLQRSLPFVEAVYGSAAFVPVAPQLHYRVFVTPSGYLIKSNPRNTSR